MSRCPLKREKLLVASLGHNTNSRDEREQQSFVGCIRNCCDAVGREAGSRACVQSEVKVVKVSASKLRQPSPWRSGKIFAPKADCAYAVA